MVDSKTLKMCIGTIIKDPEILRLVPNHLNIYAVFWTVLVLATFWQLFVVFRTKD